MNSWFEYDNGSNRVKEPAQLAQQRSRILKILEKERLLLGGDARKLVIWGLSQGAGLAIDVALAAPCAIGAVLALRGMAIEGPTPVREGAWPVNVLAINGERDRLCPPDEAKRSYEALQSSGVSLTFVTEPSLAHGCARGRQSLCRPELLRVAAFLSRVWERC